MKTRSTERPTARPAGRGGTFWHVVMVLEIVVMAVSLGIGVGPGNTERGLPGLIKALLGSGSVNSPAWLWVGRIALVALIVSVIHYVRVVEPRLRRS